MTDRWWLKCPKCNEYFFTADWEDKGEILENCEHCDSKLRITFTPKVELAEPNVKLETVSE